MKAFDRTVYPSALGEAWVIANIHGPAVKLAGPQDEPCIHYLTEQEARDAAAALLGAADEIRDQERHG